MSWKLIRKNRNLLADEMGPVVKDPGGKTTVALVYPNTYGVGMSNLAVHSLYKILNSHPAIACERAFMPDGGDIGEHERTQTPVLTIETQRPISEFDIIAFTVSFENDLLNIIPILEMSKINHRADERGDDDPKIIAGGAAITLNPRPLEHIVDACIVGEFEARADLVEMLRQRALTALTQSLSVKNLDDYPTQTVIHTPHTTFGNMHLIEVMRGCGRGCSFCATPGLYGPPRFRSFDAVMAMIDEGSKHCNKYGLIGADIVSHPKFTDIADSILDRDMTFSLSSVRIDRITPDIAKILARAGMRSISLGIEAGTDRLRKSTGKKFTDERCMKSIALLAAEGITNVRLYFMIGLPGETYSDIEAIPQFADRVRSVGASSVECTVTPFVPKPLSNYSDEFFVGIERINRIQKRLKQLMGGTKGLRISFDSAQQAAVEAYLAKVGPEAIEFLEEAHRTSPRSALGDLG